ncbi:MAG TPA: MBL fold metallo-hydrolase [Gemmatimonadales bacterium]|nr:MBL fold metallo-hydrolase [Gemmatimonadales bacterium]
MTRPPHHRPGGGYQNPWPASNPRGFSHLVRWFFERNFTNRPAPDPPRSVFEVATPEFGRAGPDGLAVTWLGHSTALVEAGGVTILTDPIFGTYASPIPTASLKRWVDPPVPVAGLPRVDLVLLSHNHYDHLDAPTVRELATRQPEATWCTPLGNAELLRSLGVARIEEFDWWQEREVGRARVGCTPAKHFSARGLHDRSRALWGGFTVAAGGRRIYFAGDTAYHPEFAQVGERLGPFDLVLMPVGAYEPRWFMHVVHVNPEEAVRAFRDLAGGADPPPRMVPIHWGTFKLTDEPMDEPPRRAEQAWREAGLPPDRLCRLRHGETRRFPP